MLVMAQRVDHGIRYSAYANLQRCAVWYLVGNKLSDACLHLGWHRCWHLLQRFIAATHCGYLADMDDRITKGARHILIHLRNDGFGALRTREGDVGTDTVGAIAILVGFADIKKSHIHWHLSATKEEWHFA